MAKKAGKLSLLRLPLFVILSFLLKAGGKHKKAAKGAKKGEPEIDFEEISKDLANLEERQHVREIGPAVQRAYFKEASYTDEKGRPRIRQKFKRKGAEKVGDVIYDALGYHIHRFFFDMDQKQYDNLKQYKDKSGNSYIDTVTQHHLDLSRRGLKKGLAKFDENNDITHKTLQDLLEKHVEHHKTLIRTGLIAKNSLDDPKHMKAVKGAIDKIVAKYDFLDKKKFDTSKMHDANEIIQTYVALSQHYKDK